ncbi:MAG TPA: heat-inducible transcriptional repressor HrcA, partial [candidate division Zixibacteria bacterium]|nr:heat-inducible transcriptional repressor HrcA [candidate division Zixibacteria bacterium]
MAFENLSERERAVLANLINHYITTADPVGSRVIATKYQMGLSSATIRNTMQDLEDLGLITQPHTSAGRVPTDLGYRLYVDALIQRETLSEKEEALIRSSIAGRGRSVEAILGQSTRALAEIASQMGVTVAPKFESGKLSRLQLVRLSSEKILVVLVVRSGLARTVILEVEASLPEEELRLLESILNERLAGLSLGEIRGAVSDRLTGVEGNPRLLKLFVDPDSSIWRGGEAQMHIMGAENLLCQPEFADRAQLVEFVRALQDESKLIGELSTDHDNTEAPGVMVKIGSENSLSEMKRCSVVSANYKIGHIEGKIAVIGPTRMRYSKLLSIVEYAT